MIRMRPGTSYSLVDFVVKYDKSVDWPVWFGMGYFGTPNYGSNVIEISNPVTMEVVNGNIIVIRKESGSISNIFSKASKEFIEDVKKLDNVTFIGNKRVSPPSGGIRKEIDIRNKSISSIAKELGARYKNRRLRLR